MPNNGKLLNNKGKIAQCIAQATDVTIPKASQFILNFIKYANIIIAILLQKFFCSYQYQLKLLYFCYYNYE